MAPFFDDLRFLFPEKSKRLRLRMNFKPGHPFKVVEALKEHHIRERWRYVVYCTY